MQVKGVALIGAGFMGKAHSLAYAIAPIALDAGVRLEPRVLVDAAPGVAERQAAALGWPGHAEDWRAVLERDDVDVIDICTPPQLHEEIALAAIAAGKHVFCEKPIANSVAEAARMADAAAERGVVAQVGFNYRHTSAFAFGAQLLREGRLGAPLQLRASYLQETAFTASPDRWRARRATGGSGMVGDIGSHVIDMAQLLLGDIVRVAARMRAQPGEDGWGPEVRRTGDDLVDDAGVWVAEFAGGALGSFAINSFASGHKNHIRVELDATRGALEFDWNSREQLRISSVDDPVDQQGFRTVHTSDVHPDGWWRMGGLGTGYSDVMAVQFHRFARAIATGEQPSPSFDDALQVQRVVAAIAAAAEGDGWVDVEPRSAR